MHVDLSFVIWKSENLNVLFPKIFLELKAYILKYIYDHFNCLSKFAYVFTLDYYFTPCWILIQKNKSRLEKFPQGASDPL